MTLKLQIKYFIYELSSKHDLHRSLLGSLSDYHETVISDIRDEGDIMYLLNIHRNITSLYLFLI